MFWEKSLNVGGLVEQRYNSAELGLFDERPLATRPVFPERPTLSTVTLCAVSSVNVAATMAALHASLDNIDFAECLLFTDKAVSPFHPAIRVVQIPRIESSRRYSEFLLNGLLDHVRTEHCMIVQWDGFVLDASRWTPEFLTYDYVGAPWPQWGAGEDVGNGGFSLRSRRLLEACRDPEFDGDHPEDVAICRVNRRLLEGKYGIRFADRETAERFAFERNVPAGQTFGFHGIFNMIRVLGVDRFWEIYSTLDNRRTAFVDYWLLMRQLALGPNAFARCARLTIDRIRDLLRL